MSQTSNNSKRIAKNTLFLYLRMFVMMVISLFTSRVVLAVLGAQDYGIYNIIGGVIVLFSFLNSALNAATQRFLNFNLGKKDYVQANEVFCMSLNIYIILSLIIFVLAETVGLWFVNTQLNIPATRMIAANWVYQFTIITFIINIIRIPYNASILAYERMDFYAYTSLGEVVLKLLVVYVLYLSSFDKLIVYALLYTIVPLLITIVYKVFCSKNFKICRYKKSWSKEIFRNLFGFTGWSLFGSVATMSAQQGLNILINIFYGVTVNAAVGVANQVCAAVNQFVGNFQTAFRPQIIKDFAAGEYDKFYNLIFSASKFSFYMMFVLAFPIMLTIDSILSIWLVKVPPYTNIFCQLILVVMIIEAVATPLWMSVEARGNIRNYQILMSCVIILNFPLAYAVLACGLPVYCVWCVKIFVTLLVFVTRCWYIKKYMKFPLWDYMQKVLLKIFLVTLVAMPIPLAAKFLLHSFWLNLIAVLAISFIISVLDIYFIGLSSSEKKLVNSIIIKRIPFLKR